MKGLLIKDIRLLMNQGEMLFLMLIAVSLMLSVMGVASPLFVVSYITIIFSFFTSSTISYDEYDNCYLFLMALPVTRKSYVNEKYLFGLLTTIIAWLVGVVVGAILLLAGKEHANSLDWIGQCVMCMLVAWLFLSVMIPLRLKFEAEKAKYINMILLVVCVLIVFVGSQMSPYLPGHIVAFFASFGKGGILLLSVVITVAAMIVSYAFSCHIMKRKQF